MCLESENKINSEVVMQKWKSLLGLRECTLLDLLGENVATQPQFTEHCKETTTTILKIEEEKKRKEGLVVDRNCVGSLRLLILEWYVKVKGDRSFKRPWNSGSKSWGRLPSTQTGECREE